MILTFDTNLAKMMAEIAQMLDGPNFATLAALESALEDSFNFSQEIVRVDTGSLRNSGITESNVAGDVWVGTLTYGGPSPGAVKDPVTYALAVVAYDAPQDWISVTAEATKPLFEAAMAIQWGT